MNGNLNTNNLNPILFNIINYYSYFKYSYSVELFQNLPFNNLCCFKMKRKNHILGKWVKFGGLYPDWEFRLFRKKYGNTDYFRYLKKL